MELEESTCLTLGYTTKPQSSRCMVLAKRQKIDQWNKIESPEINPQTYGYLIFDKEARIYNGKKTTSLTSGAGETGQPLVKELNQNTFKHHTHTKKTQNGLKI